MLSLVLATFLAQSGAAEGCTRYESATETVTVCHKPAPVAHREPRWTWVFVKDVTGSWATVVDCYSDETWTVPAWAVKGPKNIGRNVRLFTSHGAL